MEAYRDQKANPQTPEAGDQKESLPFTATANRLAVDIAAAAHKLGDASQEFASLIQSFVSAGSELEKALSAQRELGTASLKAVQDAREAAAAASAAADGAKNSENTSRELMEQTSMQYGTVSSLVRNLQERIAALSVLAAPMPQPEQVPTMEEVVHEDEHQTEIEE